MFTYKKEIKHELNYDVMVAGGGSSGCAAALAVARGGLKTLIVESLGQLGGTGTSGLVSHWLGGRSKDCKKWIVGGIFKEMAMETAELGISTIPEVPADGKLSPHGWGSISALTAGIPFDPFKMAAYLDEKMLQSKVDMLFFTQFVDVIKDDAGRKIKQAVIFNKSGFSLVNAGLFIDATGDADVAAASGCPYVKGRDKDNLCAPVTLEFIAENVDTDALSEYIHKNDSTRFLAEIKDLREKGIWNFDYDRFITVMLSGDNEFMINTSRLCGVDGTDGASISQAMVQGRKETRELLDIICKHFPGFDHAKIKAVASLLGVRETRRIKGEGYLSVADLCSGKSLPDIVGYSAYGWDLPDPKKPSIQPMDDRKEIIIIP